MTGQRCCGHCFGDRGLIKQIIPTITSSRGKCSFCLDDDVELVEPSELAAAFETLVGIYEPDPSGHSFLQWLKTDWDMFHRPEVDDSTARSLLISILGTSTAVDDLVMPSARYHSDGLTRWETLRDELMYQNRYFPVTHIDTDRLEQLLSHLRADEIPATWYRARLQTSETAFVITEMGAPSKRTASVGRANPPGIPYLYLASTPDTAIAETRPHAGEIACVAEFTVPSGRTIVDLRNPRRLVSPFLLADEDEIGLLRSDITLLERFGDELTRPIVPHGAAIDYVPSQYLCEFIKRSKYEGVIYRSSVSDGMNLALFDPNIATNASGVTQFVVDHVAVKIRPK